MIPEDLSSENEICDACLAARKLHRQRDEFGLWPELGPALKAAKEHTEAAWLGAIDGAAIDEDQNGIVGKLAQAEAASDAALAAWDTALSAAEAADFYGAFDELEHARSLAAEWGDDSNERGALGLIAKMRDYDFAEPRIGLEANCEACIAICKESEEDLASIEWDYNHDR